MRLLSQEEIDMLNELPINHEKMDVVDEPNMSEKQKNEGKILLDALANFKKSAKWEELFKKTCDTALKQINKGN